jgi:isoleucyl-tRNA synthetase
MWTPSIGLPNVGANDLAINVFVADGHKCDRCWRYTDDVGQEQKYPTVCLRCAQALDAIDFPPYPATTS